MRIRNNVATSVSLPPSRRSATGSRLNALRWQLAIDRYIKDHRYAIGTLVANKFQNGFDVDLPRLCSTHVDKRLTGIRAVQTRLPLNRAHPGKTPPTCSILRTTPKKFWPPSRPTTRLPNSPLPPTRIGSSMCAPILMWPGNAMTSSGSLGGGKTQPERQAE